MSVATSKIHPMYTYFLYFLFCVLRKKNRRKNFSMYKNKPTLIATTTKAPPRVTFTRHAIQYWEVWCLYYFLFNTISNIIRFKWQKSVRVRETNKINGTVVLLLLFLLYIYAWKHDTNKLWIMWEQARYNVLCYICLDYVLFLTNRLLLLWAGQFSFALFYLLVCSPSQSWWCSFLSDVVVAVEASWQSIEFITQFSKVTHSSFSFWFFIISFFYLQIRFSMKLKIRILR